MHVEVVAAVALLAGLWVGAWRAGAGPLPRARAAAFATGLLLLLAALVGPLHDRAEASLFAAHMVQHLLLTLGVAPALLAGMPPAWLDRLLEPALRRPVPAALARLATRPVPALAAHAAALLAWHLPATYRLALDSHAWHFLQHATLTVTAMLAWWPVLAPSRRLPPLPYGARLLYLFAFGVPMTVLAAMITGADDPLYPSASPTPLADQRLGGILMWVPAGIVPLVAFTVVFFRWVAAERDDPAWDDHPAGFLPVGNRLPSSGK
jgi:putative membrane protein